MDPQKEFCLTWNNHPTHLAHGFSGFWMSQSLTDCTLACGGNFVKAHKLILAACSSFFEEIICQCGSDKEPVIVLGDTPYADLCAILEFMYCGEVRVPQEELTSLLTSAENLRIKGLSDMAPNLDMKANKQSAKEEKKNADESSPASPNESNNSNPKPDNEDDDDLNMEAIDEGPDDGEGNEGSIGLSPRSKSGHDDEDAADEMMRSDRNGEDDSSDNPLIPSVSFSEGPEVGSGVQISVVPRNQSMGPSFGRPGGWSQSTNSELKSLMDQIVKIDYYVNVQGRARSQYWKEPWISRVMEMISRNALDIKNAAELLGVSYAVLYTKYREVYGYRNQGMGAGRWKPGPIRGRPPVAMFPLAPPVAPQPQAEAGPVRAPRRRSTIDWGNEQVQNVCRLISSRQISIKKGSEMLGIDYSTLYYHIVKNSPAKYAARQAGASSAGSV